jgi:predicted ATPase
MTSPAELLKTAAAEIDRLTGEVSKLQSDNAVLAQSIKTASEKQVKTAADLGDLAVTVGKTLLDRGLVKSAQDADKLSAACLADHSVALKTIAKVAGYVSTAPKIGTVVLSDSNKPETADQAWDRAFGALA